MTAALVATAIVYLRGWRELRVQMPQRFGGAQLGAFLIGLSVVFLAVASPLDAFAGLLLQVHMAQHLLLTMVAPPLLWLGAPSVPLLRGLPTTIAKSALGPFLGAPRLQAAVRTLVHPVVSWTVFAATVVAWHLPGPYQLALRAPGWHVVEHLTFLGAGLLFWWPVVQPWPSQPLWPRWTMIPYLLLADLLNTIVAAFFVFSERVLYPHYAAVPRLAGISPLDDQITAGALMWVPGAIAFVLPTGLIALEVLNGRRVRPSALGTASTAVLATQASRKPPAAAQEGRFDLLHLPLLGGLLRWRHGRRAAQLAMFGLALAVIVDGLRGPQMAPMNLAGVLPWTYWRALAVLALLIAGNFFCLACPFMLPRELAKRLLPARRAWPPWLRAKWLAAALLALYLWAYEALAPWDSPWWTAVIALGYFAAAFVVDGVFRGASFCKYVCPIGQFNFVASLASPLTVRVRRLDTCRACTSHDCLRGNARQRGCELDLFQPEKRGNLDCTFCLDCVAACPHDNVGILTAVPARDLAADRYRSSLRRLSERPDIAALALVFVFGAFANAAGMTAPILAWQHATAARLGLASTMPVVTVGLALALIVAPAAVLAVACAPPFLTFPRKGGRDPRSSAANGPRAGNRPRAEPLQFVFSLVPLGLAMWTAHFLFHLVTGASALRPVLQRAVNDVGGVVIGTPAWAAAGADMSSHGLTALQLLLLDGGLLFTLYVGWRIAVHERAGVTRVLVALLPWAVLSLTLWAIGVWIVFQPMQMRGMLH